MRRRRLLALAVVAAGSLGACAGGDSPAQVPKARDVVNQQNDRSHDVEQQVEQVSGGDGQ